MSTCKHKWVYDTEVEVSIKPKTVKMEKPLLGKGTIEIDTIITSETRQQYHCELCCEIKRIRVDND